MAQLLYDECIRCACPENDQHYCPAKDCMHLNENNVRKEKNRIYLKLKCLRRVYATYFGEENSLVFHVEQNVCENHPNEPWSYARMCWIICEVS